VSDSKDLGCILLLDDHTHYCSQWTPVTKLGRLVKDGKIKSLEEIYLFSLPIKECEIIDFFIGSSLKDEVLKIMPVQKQTRAGQRTRFKVGLE